MPEIVTTYLEMTAPAQLVAAPPADSEFIVREDGERGWQLNRELYLQVGEPWEWNDKRRWTDEQWAGYVASDQLRTFVASWRSSLAGYYELRRDDAQAVEIAYFGLVPDFIGRGFGGALLTDALRRAWAWDARRVWVHTCTRDHPAALRNYQSRGMRIYGTETSQVA